GCRSRGSARSGPCVSWRASLSPAAGRLCISRVAPSIRQSPLEEGCGGGGRILHRKNPSSGATRHLLPHAGEGTTTALRASANASSVGGRKACSGEGGNSTWPMHDWPKPPGARPRPTAIGQGGAPVGRPHVADARSAKAVGGVVPAYEAMLPQVGPTRPTHDGFPPRPAVVRQRKIRPEQPHHVNSATLLPAPDRCERPR